MEEAESGTKNRIIHPARPQGKYSGQSASGHSSSYKSDGKIPDH
jgi:hypothetical protein